MLTEFGKVLAFLILAIVFVVIALFMNKFVRPNRPTHEKLLVYECGEDTLGPTWVKFNIRFYVVALIFLIFDVEIVLLMPWAMVYQELGLIGYAVGFFFLALLTLGMVYEWKKGDLEWARPEVTPLSVLPIKQNTAEIPELENVLPANEKVNN